MFFNLVTFRSSILWCMAVWMMMVDSLVGHSYWVGVLWPLMVGIGSTGREITASCFPTYLFSQLKSLWGEILGEEENKGEWGEKRQNHRSKFGNQCTYYPLSSLRDVFSATNIEKTWNTYIHTDIIHTYIAERIPLIWSCLSRLETSVDSLFFCCEVSPEKTTQTRVQVNRRSLLANRWLHWVFRTRVQFFFFF